MDNENVQESQLGYKEEMLVRQINQAHIPFMRILEREQLVSNFKHTLLYRGFQLRQKNKKELYITYYLSEISTNYTFYYY